MRRRPPISTRTDTLLPSTTLVRSGLLHVGDCVLEGCVGHRLLGGYGSPDVLVFVALSLPSLVQRLGGLLLGVLGAARLVHGGAVGVQGLLDGAHRSSDLAIRAAASAAVGTDVIRSVGASVGAGRPNVTRAVMRFILWSYMEIGRASCRERVWQYV